MKLSKQWKAIGPGWLMTGHSWYQMPQLLPGPILCKLPAGDKREREGQ